MGGKAVTTEIYMEDVKDIHKGSHVGFVQNTQEAGSKAI